MVTNDHAGSCYVIINLCSLLVFIFQPVVSVSFFSLLDSASPVSPGDQHVDDHVHDHAGYGADSQDDDDHQQHHHHNGHRWRSREKQRYGFLIRNWRSQTWRKTSRSHSSLFWYSRIFNVENYSSWFETCTCVAFIWNLIWFNFQDSFSTFIIFQIWPENICLSTHHIVKHIAWERPKPKVCFFSKSYDCFENCSNIP